MNKGGYTHLCRVNVSVREGHRHVVLIHYFTAQVTNNGRVGMVTEGHLFSEYTDIGIAHRTVDVVREVIASR